MVTTRSAAKIAQGLASTQIERQSLAGKMSARFQVIVGRPNDWASQHLHMCMLFGIFGVVAAIAWIWHNDNSFDAFAAQIDSFVTMLKTPLAILKWPANWCDEMGDYHCMFLLVAPTFGFLMWVWFQHRCNEAMKQQQNTDHRITRRVVR